MAFTVVIPARLASTRLPRKVLLDIAGKPMLERVYQQALASSAAEVVIATDSDEVVEVAQGFSANVVKTRADHPSGTDRLQEVAQHFGFDDKHIIVNVQGDEPLLPPALIDQVAQNLADNPQAGIATLCEPITELDEVLNPNAVKVVFDKNGKALYFSRASIPFAREGFNVASAQWYRHIGIYAYRSGFLHDFVSWPPAPLEQTEHLEQLRAMYNGVDIHVDVAAQTVPAGVDTEADLTAVRAFFEARP